MAIRRKAKARRKRKKASITTTARTTGKKTVNKASPRPVSTKKAKPPAKTMGKPTSVSERAPEADGPRPSRPAEQRIGVVTHYYGYLPVVAMRLEPGATLRVGNVSISADIPPISPRRSNRWRLIARQSPKWDPMIISE